MAWSQKQIIWKSGSLRDSVFKQIIEGFFAPDPGLLPTVPEVCRQWKRTMPASSFIRLGSCGAKLSGTSCYCFSGASNLQSCLPSNSSPGSERHQKSAFGNRYHLRYHLTSSQRKAHDLFSRVFKFQVSVVHSSRESCVYHLEHDFYSAPLIW